LSPDVLFSLKIEEITSKFIIPHNNVVTKIVEMEERLFDMKIIIECPSVNFLNLLYWQWDSTIFKSMWPFVYNLQTIYCTLFLTWAGQHPLMLSSVLKSCGQFLWVFDVREIVIVVGEVGWSGFLVCWNSWCSIL
jgi:hypothetical protein